MKIKGIPKKDGSGGGMRLNKGRGGCKITKKKGKGMNIDEVKTNRWKW